jgi:hypothetical protein
MTGISYRWTKAICSYLSVHCASAWYFLRRHGRVFVIVKGKAEIDHHRGLVRGIVVVSGVAKNDVVRLNVGVNNRLPVGGSEGLSREISIDDCPLSIRWSVSRNVEARVHVMQCLYQSSENEPEERLRNMFRTKSC